MVLWAHNLRLLTRGFFHDAREMDMGCIEDYYDGEQSKYGLASLDDGADEQLLCSGKYRDCNRTTCWRGARYSVKIACLVDVDGVSKPSYYCHSLREQS